MKNAKPKLIETLLSIDQKEWKSVKRFVLLHTTEHTEYYKLISKLCSQKKLAEFDTETFREKHFQEIKPKNFLNMMSKLLEWIEDWLVYRLIGKNQNQKKLYLIRAYNDIGLYKQANTHAEKIEQTLKNQKGLDIESTKQLQELKHIQYYSNNPIKYNVGYEILNDLVQLQRQSFKEYTMTYMMELKNRTDLSGFDFNTLIKECNKTLLSIPDSPESKVIETALEFFEKSNTESIHSIFEKLEDGKIKNNTEFHLLIYSYLWRYERIKRAEGLIKDKLLLIKILEYGITSGIYSTNGKILFTQLNNLIVRLCLFQERKEVDSFLEKWIDKVSTKDKASCLNHCKAVISFYFEDYNDILDKLKDVRYENITTKVIGQSLKAIALYEIKEESLLLNHISNFRRLLNRNKRVINQNSFQSHFNLSKLIEAMVKSKYDNSINLNLSNYQPLFYRSWFIKKGIK